MGHGAATQKLDGWRRAALARRRWLRELDGAVEPQVMSETRQAPDPGRRDSFPAATELRATMAAPGTQRERHENRGSEPERGGKEEKKRGRGDGILEELEHEGGARGGWVRRRGGGDEGGSHSVAEGAEAC